MPPETTPAANTPVKVTNEASYLFGKIGKVISATEHEIVVLFDEAEAKIKETFDPAHVASVTPPSKLSTPTPPPVVPQTPPVVTAPTPTSPVAPAATPPVGVPAVPATTPPANPAA